MQGTVGSGLCYVVMSSCVKQRGPVFISAFSPFIQIFVAVFDISILHEQIHLGSVLGSILVIAAMYILLWGKSNEAETCAIKQTHQGEEDGDCNRVLQSSPIAINPSTAYTLSLCVILNVVYFASTKGFLDRISI
ncbi:unnamed protein product [Ilex paraguariensis]|uniref:WAT1-related protein n=1 Tax=Ilex paraguariensis TaxID=185542 RepID=A0ABC8TCH2_9AQUA